MPHPTAPAVPGPAPASPDLRQKLGGALLLVAFGAHLLGVLAGLGWPIVLSGTVILLYLALNLRLASPIVRLFFGVAMLLLALDFMTGDTVRADIGSGFARLSFLSSILIALGFLRLIAMRDRNFFRAGAYLASRPPAARYVSLGVGGNLFGVLLNLGGLGLLIEMTLDGQRRSEAENGVSPAIHAARERRIVSAIMRGFATVAYWSPFGIALNTLLLIFPQTHWSNVAPYGLSFTAVFLAGGALMDMAERRLFPLFPKPPRPTPVPGQGRGLVMVVAHLLVLAGIVLGLDAILPYSFQQVLVAVVPVYAAIWSVAVGGASGPVRLLADFIRRAPAYVNEIGVFALAGLIGALLISMVPQDRLEPVVSWIVTEAGGAVALVLALFWATLLAAGIGIHPIITVAVFAELTLRVDVPISDIAVIMALMSGWACTVILAPLATTATYVGSIVGRGPLTLTLGWNGVFGGVIVAVLSLLLAFGVQGGWL